MALDGIFFLTEFHFNWQQETGAGVVRGIVIIRCVPGQWSVAGDGLAELGFYECEGVWNVVALPVECLGWEAVLRSSKQQLESFRVVQWFFDKGYAVLAFFVDYPGVNQQIPTFL